MSEATDAAGWRIELDRRDCISSGVCVGIAPRHFEVDEDGTRPVATRVVPDNAVVDAAESCPAEAITVVDEADGTLVAPV